MSLLSPWGLLWLLSLPLLVVFYLFRPEPRRRLSTTFFLWRRSQPDSQGGVFARRLRSNPLLWLQLLALLLLSLYLARPATRWNSQAPRSSRVVLVLDRSASMQAGGAFEQAIEKAREAVDGLFGGGPLGSRPEVMLLAVDRDPQILVPFSSDPQELRRALDAVRPTEIADRLGSLRALLGSLIADQKASVWLFSDHLPAELELPGLQYSACGQELTTNVAMTAFSVELSREAGTPRPFLYARLENFSDSAEQRLLRVEKMSSQAPETIEATVWESSFLIPAGAGRTVSQPLPSSALAPSEVSLFRARLLPLPGAADRDELAADNAAYTVAPPFAGEKLRVALSKELKAGFLVRALGATAKVEIVEWESLLRRPDGETVDLLITPPAPRLPAAPTVRTRFEVSDAPPQADTPVETLRAEPAQPLVKDAGAEWNRLRVQRDPRWATSPQESVLLSTASGPALTLKGLEQGQPTLCWRFPLAFSSLPLSPALPVVVGRFLDEYSRPASRGWPGSFSTSVRVGRPAGAAWRGELKLLPPSNSPEAGEMLVERDDRQLPRLSWSGFYAVKGGEARSWLAMNLFSAAESRLPREASDRAFASPELSSSQESAGSRQGYREISTPLAAGAFLLLLLEAAWFLRRGRP